MARPWLLVGCAIGLLGGGCDGADAPRVAIDAEPPPLPQGDLPLLICVEPAPRAGECVSDAECGSAHCVLEVTQEVSDRAPVPLSCSAPQGLGEARKPCAAREDCQSGLCSLTGACLAPCGGSADCPSGMFCLPVEVRLSAQALSPVMACARNLAFEADVAVSAGPVSSTVGSSDRGAIDLSSRDGTSMIYLKPSCGTELQVESLRGHDGEELFDIDQALNGRPSPNPVANVGALVPVLVPNNPGLTGYEQGLEVDFLVSNPSEVSSLIASRAPGPQRVLDLNLFYVGAGSDLVEGGFHPGDPRVHRLVEELGRLYDGIDITLGAVREFDVVGTLRDELSVIEGELIRDEWGQPIGLDVQGLDRLFGLTLGLEYGGLNLFLLSDLGDLLGISGGIPGALGVHGSAGSGVALALDVIGMEAAPQVAMHEMSHQMGLFHTTEFDGLTIEPLDDTPVCSSARDKNGDGILVPSECVAAGADNLMFWSGDGRALSPEQREVLQRSIVLR